MEWTAWSSFDATFTVTEAEGPLCQKCFERGESHYVGSFVYAKFERSLGVVRANGMIEQFYVPHVRHYHCFSCGHRWEVTIHARKNRNEKL